MQPNIRNLISAGTAALAIMSGLHVASAVPINGKYVEDARCDNIPSQFLTHELGQTNLFPINERIQAQFAPATFTVCVPDDLIQNDWIVQMTNTSGTAWKNLFFVANAKITIGNADGSMLDLVNAPNLATDAFRIDGTVTAGFNNNLLSESGIVDEIFSPGETWRFNVSNFADTAGSSPPPRFRSPGVFAGGSPFVTGNVDTASILATPVPEPTTIGAIGLIAASLLMRRPRRARTSD